MTDTPGTLEERLRTTKFLSLRNQFALQVEAADEIASLRARVEAAEADAALARQGYQTAYNEFDKKCRTVNQLVCERIAMREALEKIERTPAWGATEKWETTPAEVRIIARQALKPSPVE